MKREVTCPSCQAKLLVPEGGNVTGTCPRCLAVIDTTATRSAPQATAPVRPEGGQQDIRAGSVPDPAIRTPRPINLDREVAGDHRATLTGLWVVAMFVVLFLFATCAGAGTRGGMVSLDPITLLFGIPASIAFLTVFAAGLYKMDRSKRRGIALASGVFLFLLLSICSGVVFGFVTCTAIFNMPR